MHPSIHLFVEKEFLDAEKNEKKLLHAGRRPT